MSLDVGRVRTRGVFRLDGERIDVENNVWIVGDDTRVIVVDAAHDADAIAAGVSGRRAIAIVCTHAHNDHVNAAVELSEALHAPVALHPADRVLWDAVHPGRSPDLAMSDGDHFDLGGEALRVLHTPGHSPGGVCLLDERAQTLFSGDTLFRGGPGATGRSFSSFPDILESIRGRLFALDPSTTVHTGHGDDTTIGDELPHLDEWTARGF